MSDAHRADANRLQNQNQIITNRRAQKKLWHGHSLSVLETKLEKIHNLSRCAELYTHNMITALASHHVCHNSVLRQKNFVNTNGRSSCVFVPRERRTKELESRSHHLERLKIFILPMNLLEAHYVVVLKELLRVFEFELPVSL